MISKIGDNLKALKNKIFKKTDNNQNSKEKQPKDQNQAKNDIEIANQLIQQPHQQNPNSQENGLRNNEQNNLNPHQNNQNGDQNIHLMNQQNGQINAHNENNQQKKKKSSISSQLQQKFQIGSDALKGAIKKAAGQVNEIKKEVSNEYNKFDQKYKETMKQQKEKFNVWIRLKVEQAILNILQKQKPKIKRLLTDPYMFKSVKQLIHDMVDDTWPSIEEYIREELRPTGYKRKVVNIQEVKPDVPCYLWPWYILKSWYRYTTNPYNKSVWHKIRRISWWFILIINLFPLYGVQSFLHALYFLLIDKSDEWQLLLYIVSFKRMQYFSLGVTGSLIGYALFFSCATINDYESDSDYYRCKDEGPGSKINIITDIVGFLLQIVLCWIGFFMIPYTKTKGQILYKTVKPNISNKSPSSENKYNLQKLNNQSNEQKEQINQNNLQNQINIYYLNNNNASIQEEEVREESDMCCFKFSEEKGGRLKCFMIYDFIIFFICLALMLISIFVGKDTTEDWQKYQLVYLMKTIYGFLNFPWLIFLFPPMMTIITRAKETGYDKYGVTQLRYVNYDDIKKQKAEQRKVIKEKQQQEREKQNAFQDSSIDANQQNQSIGDLERDGLLRAELNVEELIQQQNQQNI